MNRPISYLVSCEHGGNEVPEGYRHLFEDQEALLASHRGYDPGALELARVFARALGAPMVGSTVTRLLADLNRTRRHRGLFSEVSRGLDARTKREILRRYYDPHWEAVDGLVRSALDRGQLLVHVAAHSFTPVLDGDVRKAEVGILYDPSRSREATLGRAWQKAIGAEAPTLRVRRNYPYLGTANSLPADLRRRFPEENYLGLELEVNQKFPLTGGAPWSQLKALLPRTLKTAMMEAGLTPAT